MAVGLEQVRDEPCRGLAIRAANGRQIVHGFACEQDERYARRQRAYRLVADRAPHDDQPVDPRGELACELLARGRPCVARISRLEPAATLAASAPSSTDE